MPHEATASGLTEQQELFRREWVARRNGVAAYRIAFPAAAAMKLTSVSERASRLRNDPMIAARIVELQAELDRHGARALQPRATLGGGQSRAPTRSGPYPLASNLVELERVAAVVFDADQPEAARVAAMRLATDALLHLARAVDPRMIRVSIHVEPGSPSAGPAESIEGQTTC